MSIHKEATMGILDTFFPQKTQPTASGQYIPANETALTRAGSAMRDSGTAILNRGVDIYKAHPKKIQMLGILAGAILLSRMKRGR
jgi:hypothetical protein